MRREAREDKITRLRSLASYLWNKTSATVINWTIHEASLINQSINLSPPYRQWRFFLSFFLFFLFSSSPRLPDLNYFSFILCLPQKPKPHRNWQPRQVRKRAGKQPSRISDVTQNKGSRSHPHMPKGKKGKKKRDTWQILPYSFAGGGPHILGRAREVFAPLRVGTVLITLSNSYPSRIKF